MLQPTPATAVRVVHGAVRAPWRWALWLALLLTLAAGTVSAADAPDAAEMRKAEAAATEAKVFFKAGLFDKASAKFMEAYAISKRPSLMYNAARAYEEGLNYREAIALLNHYKDLPDVGGDGKRDAEQRIARMDGVLRQQAEIDAAKAEAARLAAIQAAAELKLRQDEERARRERDRQTLLPQDPTPVVGVPTPRHVSWPLVASALGVGFLAGGAYIEALYEANQARSMSILDDNDVTAYEGHASDARTFQAVAITGAAVGVGLATWALIDWWTSGGNATEKSASKSSVSVFPAPGGGMLGVRGSF